MEKESLTDRNIDEQSAANGPRVRTNKHTHKLLLLASEVRLYVYVEIFAFSFSKSIFVN